MRAVPPPQVLRVGVVNPANKAKSSLDEGPTPQMPVSLNIDRHLRKAQGFFDRGQFSSAFRVLQDVIEGRTLTDEGIDEPSDPPAGPGKDPDSGQGKPSDAAPPQPFEDVWELNSALHAVFSEDERLFRPVRRLCHEMLASLPTDGLSVYRTEFEVGAQSAFEAARDAEDISALEDVYGRFFVTLSAGRALALAGDLRMDRGAFRAALSDYRSLLWTYPEELRSEAGIDEVFIRLKIALCLARLGSQDSAKTELAELAEDHPDRTIRVLGELVAVSSLASHPMFAASATASSKGRNRSGTDLAQFPVDADLVPLWEHRFTSDKPYRRIRDPRNNRRNTFIIGFGGTNGNATGSALSPERYAPGTSTALVDDHIVFLDHFRVRAHEALSGRMSTASDGPLTERLKAGAVRARGGAIDFVCGRIIDIGDSIVTIVGPGKKVRGASRLVRNRLVAFDPDTLETRWSSENDPALKKLTFLAAPTLHEGKLLVPTMQGGTFGLHAIDAATGKSIYDIVIHRAGTRLARPVASSVVVSQGLAYVCMNAGALAAIDVDTGTLRWTRRYERLHPIRPKPSSLDKGAKASNNNRWGQVVEAELKRLPGFAPSDFYAIDGLIILAPSDGGVLHCLDGATGQPVWMLKRLQRVPGASHLSRMSYIVGHDDDHLYVAGEHDLTCIEIRSGVRRWRDILPASAALNGSWRGRGAVTKNAVLLPGAREILVRPIDGAKPDLKWQRIRLPELSIGRDPLEGPFNIGVHGIYLTASYEGGVEVFGTSETLLSAAKSSEDPERRSLLLAQAGDLLGAFSTLEEVDLESFEDDKRQAIIRRTMSLSSELALAMAAHGARKDAIGILKRCRERLTKERDILRWHLSRIEVFRTLGDIEGVGTEQEALYARMEGR